MHTRYKKKTFLYFKECCYKVTLLIWCVLQPSYTMLTVPWCPSEFCVLSRPDSKPLAALLHVTFCQTVCFAWGHLVDHCTRHGCSFVVKIQEHPLSSLADFFIMFTSAIQSLGSRAVQNLDSRLHYA